MGLFAKYLCYCMIGLASCKSDHSYSNSNCRTSYLFINCCSINHSLTNIVAGRNYNCSCRCCYTTIDHSHNTIIAAVVVRLVLHRL